MTGSMLHQTLSVFGTLGPAHCAGSSCTLAICDMAEGAMQLLSQWIYGLLRAPPNHFKTSCTVPSAMSSWQVCCTQSAFTAPGLCCLTSLPCSRLHTTRPWQRCIDAGSSCMLSLCADWNSAMASVTQAYRSSPLSFVSAGAA